MKSIITLISLLISFNVYALENQWSSKHNIDINGNGVNETITYTLKLNKQNYDASLVVEAKDKIILWSHEYSMTKDDLIGDLLSYEGNISVEHWVKHFFDGTLTYGAKLEKTKIKNEEIDMEFMAFYSKQLKQTKNELKNLILSEKINTIFYYRASWREELIMLVYVPKLKKLVHYSAGEY